MRKIYWLIGASALAMLLLIGLQWYWLQNSKQLIEDQFTNRVSMALCSAVEKISASPECCQAVKSSCESVPGNCNDQVLQLVNDSAFSDALKSSLSFYQVELPYETNIATREMTNDTTAPPYSCSLMPILAKNDHWLQLIFQGKKDYFNQKIGFTLISTLLIILLILSLFVYAARSLFRQQKISEDNRHFFNHMTHEFSTPLTNIQLATNMMKKENTPEKKNTYLQIIDQQCVSLKRQIDNVLHLASLEHDQFSLKKEPIDLQLLAHTVTDEMNLQIQSKHASVHIHPAPADCIVTGDANHLRNVFRNLIDNALKYSPEGAHVDIDFYPGPSGCYTHVRDNGQGIASHDNERIFSRYYRGSTDDRNPDSSQSPNIPGFGLGLAYVKKILSLHHGEIRLMPSVSQGTHFELYFPK